MRHIYWDSSVFLAVLLPESHRLDRCKAVLEAGERGEIKIATSAITLTEVIHLKGKERINEGRNQIISGFFKYSYIAVRNVDRRIAEFARELIWQENIKPADSIHLATALDAKLTLMHSFDSDLIGISKKFGSPPLEISEPEITLQLKLPANDL